MADVMTRERGDALEGALEYDAAEHSFRFTPASPVDLAERAGAGGRTSLSIGTLQLEVGVATGIVLFAWGLHPRAAWQERAVGSPRAEPGVVRVSCREHLERGVAVSLAEVGRWATSYDVGTGWVRVAPAEEPDEAQVLIASNTVLGLRQGQLSSVWLRPDFE
jgi:hypothetical protein